MKEIKYKVVTNSPSTRFKDSGLPDIIDVLKDRCHIYHRDAFTELYHRYSSIILKTARKKTYSYDFDDAEQLAQDISQDVLLKIIEKIADFDFPIDTPDTPESYNIKFVGWILQIVNTAFFDVVRTNKKIMEAAHLEVEYADAVHSNLEFEEDESSDEDDEAIENIQFERLNEAISSLKDSEKEIIMFYRDYGRIEGGKWILDMDKKEILMEKYSLKSNSLDQKKKRIVEKIKKIVAQL